MLRTRKSLRSEVPSHGWMQIGSAYCSIDSCPRIGVNRHDPYNLCNFHENYIFNNKPLTGRIRVAASNLRERVRNALRSKEEKLLTDTGFTYTSGALTKEGRKVVLDILFEDEELRAKVVKLAETLKEEECPKKKS